MKEGQDEKHEMTSPAENRACEKLYSCRSIKIAACTNSWLSHNPLCWLYFAGSTSHDQLSVSLYLTLLDAHSKDDNYQFDKHDWKISEETLRSLLVYEH
jgi:hypothetical protein